MSQASNSFKVYQASAGSGKTYTIVKEYLKLCLKDSASTANFSQILAITFTNKAANEMKEKVMQQLNDILQSNPDKAPDGMEADLINELGISRQSLKDNARQLFQLILHDYSNFCVSTIDAFVQRLARSFAKDLNLPTQYNVSIDEEEVADAITERIGEQIGSSDSYLTKIVEDYSGMKFDSEKSPKIANNIHDFVKELFSEEAFQKNEENHFEAPAQYEETRTFLQRKTQPFETQCQQFTKDFGAFLTKNGLAADDFSGKSRSACLSAFKKLQRKEYGPISDSLVKVLEGDANWFAKELPKRLGPTAMEDLDKAFQQVFIPFFKTYQSQIGSYLFYKKQLDKLSLYVLRSKIKSEMEAYIGEEQIVHISEFNKRINQIMGDFSVPFVYERIGEHFKHLFIDEFQDTSVLQWQNLMPLIDNNLANNDMSMIVGDGKQSIYRWRNGEVGQIVNLPLIYDKPKGNPIFDGYERSFSNNFEFHPLNRNFRSFKNIVHFNNRFFDFSATLLPENSRKVYVDQNEYKQVSIEQQCHHQEEGYVQIELMDADHSNDEAMLSRIKELIEDLTHKGFRKSDITILVRTNKIGVLIADYLNENGIDIYSAESILLNTSEKVQLIINTLDYLIHNDNTSKIASVLYYWNVTHQADFNGVVDGIFDKVGDITQGKTSMEEVMGLEHGAFQSLLAKSYSLYDLCAALIRLYGFNTIGDAFLNFLLDVVYKWQYSDETGISSFLEFWDKKKDSLSVLCSNADAVNIMTVHKSKGLAFPVVIYPFVKDNLDERKSNSIWITPEELGFDAIPNIDKVQFSITDDSAKWSPQTRQIVEQEYDKIRLDNLNILYVAFTRAQQRLHVLSYQTKDEGKNPLNAFLKDHPDSYGDPNSTKVESPKETTIPKEIYNESTACEWFDKISIDPEPSMFWISKEDKMKPVEWGEFVHQALAEVQYAKDINHVLDPYINAGVIDNPTAMMLHGLFEQMVLDPTIYEAFTDQAKVKNECEILSRQYGIIRPDRYAELPDRIILLDYKTGQKDRKHHQQLANYITALKEMVNKKIDAYLVYLGDSVEVVPIQDQQDKESQYSIIL